MEHPTFAQYTALAASSATPSGDCPVTCLLQMLQGKWKAQVLYVMTLQPTIRFGQLKKEMPGVTNTMLTSTLRDLQADGLIDRRQFNEIPPHVEYSLTEKGRQLYPVFYAMLTWGLRYID